ncbi:hypothetical protein [Lentzea jiangxiensis]|uniref:hypothetical protein n=1 Tax=Lentzea jiangxiensis TaxID=641025 RepID=UPI0015A32D50|nr:hypothetical protein [Lentzea jiangxiensis]
MISRISSNSTTVFSTRSGRPVLTSMPNAAPGSSRPGALGSGVRTEPDPSISGCFDGSASRSKISRRARARWW